MADRSGLGRPPLDALLYAERRGSAAACAGVPIVWRKAASEIATAGESIGLGGAPGVIFANGAFSGVDLALGAVAAGGTWTSLGGGRRIRYDGRNPVQLRSIDGEQSGRVSLEFYPAPEDVAGSPELLDAWSTGVIGGLGLVVPATIQPDAYELVEAHDAGVDCATIGVKVSVAAPAGRNMVVLAATMTPKQIGDPFDASSEYDNLSTNWTLCAQTGIDRPAVLTAGRPTANLVDGPTTILAGHEFQIRVDQAAVGVQTADVAISYMLTRYPL